MNSSAIVTTPVMAAIRSSACVRARRMNTIATSSAFTTAITSPIAVLNQPSGSSALPALKASSTISASQVRTSGRVFMLEPSRTADQVEQGIQQHPDHVDEVPVQAGDLDRVLARSARWLVLR